MSHDRRVDDEVPERPDGGHVGGPEQSVRLHEDGHLTTVGARANAVPTLRPVWLRLIAMGELGFGARLASGCCCSRSA